MPAKGEIDEDGYAGIRDVTDFEGETVEEEAAAPPSAIDLVECLILVDEERTTPSREGDPVFVARGNDDVEYVMDRTDEVAADFLAPIPPVLLLEERVIVDVVDEETAL